MRARRPVAAIGAAVLAVTLTGCIDLSGELTVGADGTLTGQQRIEMSKEVVAAFDVTDLEGFKGLVTGDGPVLGITPTPDPTATEEDSDCPGLVAEETADTFVATCTFEGYTPQADDDLTVAVVSDRVEVRFAQTGSTGGTSPLGEVGDDAAGSIDLVLNLPGPITSVTGRTSSKAVRVDDDTVRIQGTAMEEYDVTVVATAGQAAAPANPVQTSLEPVTPSGEIEIQGLENVDDGSSGTPWGLITAALLVLALVSGGVTLWLYQRSRSAAPVVAGAAPAGSATTQTAGGTGDAGTAAPGWYPFPGDPSGQPRYWDGTSWSDPAT